MKALSMIFTLVIFSTNVFAGDCEMIDTEATPSSHGFYFVNSTQILNVYAPSRYYPQLTRIDLNSSQYNISNDGSKLSIKALYLNSANTILDISFTLEKSNLPMPTQAEFDISSTKRCFTKFPTSPFSAAICETLERGDYFDNSSSYEMAVKTVEVNGVVKTQNIAATSSCWE